MHNREAEDQEGKIIVIDHASVGSIHLLPQMVLTVRPRKFSVPRVGATGHQLYEFNG